MCEEAASTCRALAWVDNEPVKGIWVGRQTDAGNVAVGVCHRPPCREAEDNAFFRQVGEAPCLRPWSSLETLTPVVSAGGTVWQGRRQAWRLLEAPTS